MALLAVTALAGCGTAELLSVGVEPFSGTQEEASRCPPTGCFNSPELEHQHYGMHEFHLLGDYNLQRVAIEAKNGRAQIVKGSMAYDLYVQDGRLRGVQGALSIEGTALQDAEIVFLPQTAPPFVVHIDAVRHDAFAIGPHDPYEAYRLSWHDVGQPVDRKQKVCADPIQVAEGEHEQLQFLGLEPGESVVYEGDRIDGERMTIDARWQPDWFNIGCAGTALAKLFMLREAPASNPPSPSLERRRATLKMLLGDYCGGGKPFTVPGEPLLWRSLPWMEFPGAGNVPLPAHEIEARWTADGATCLGTPRLAVTKHPHVFGDVVATIAAACPWLPPCENSDAWDFDKAEIVTANPP